MVRNPGLHVFDLAFTAREVRDGRFSCAALTQKKIAFFLAAFLACSGPAAAEDPNESVRALTKNLAQHIAACWIVPPAAAGSGVNVVIDFELDRKGKLVGSPQISGGTRENSFFQITARSAIAAIHTCQPFKSLPPKQFALWKKVTWLFRP